jgi:2'-5' RNA ligase
MAHSLLMVPVLELDAVVRARMTRAEPEHALPGADEVLAHITLLGPFAAPDDIHEGLLGELRRFFSDVTPFLFELTGIHQFPGGEVYLSPSPSAPFRQLTHALARLFPEFPPYGGAFDDVVPHLTIPIPAGESIDQLKFELHDRFPIATQARSASLFWWDPGASRTLATFPFGTTAA